MDNMNNRLQDRIGWIRDLVRAEEEMENSGVVDMGTGLDPKKALEMESLRYLQTLKTEFIEAATAFNELKASPLGRVKIYGIAKTHADFMLFRNGFKMIFSLKAPGQISIRFNFIGPQQMTSQIPSLEDTAAPMMEEHVLEAKSGAFGEVKWTFNNQPVSSQAVVRHHLSMFVKESAR
jgi:hypothetical protein